MVLPARVIKCTTAVSVRVAMCVPVVVGNCSGWVNGLLCCPQDVLSRSVSEVVERELNAASSVVGVRMRAAANIKRRLVWGSAV